MPLLVRALDVPPYRGFRIGYIQGLHGYKAAWRSSLERDWHEGHVYADDLDDVERLAHECIDFNCLVEAEEAEKGRRLTQHELIALMKRTG